MTMLLDYVEVSESFAIRNEHGYASGGLARIETGQGTKYYAKKTFIDAVRRRSNLVADIRDFHERFGLRPAEVSGDVSAELLEFRRKFMQEELDEFAAAMDTRDNEAMFDALIDLVYVAIGTAYLCNWPFNTGWSRVHAANMQKKRAENKEQSKRGTAFDVVKPEGWQAPSLTDLVAPVPSVGAIADASTGVG